MGLPLVGLYLDKKTTIKHMIEVTDLIAENRTVKGIIIGDTKVYSNRVVIAPGRDGAALLTKICKKYKIPRLANHVDIGVRVEINDKIIEEINEHLYEGKFIFRSSVVTLHTNISVSSIM